MAVKHVQERSTAHDGMFDPWKDRNLHDLRSEVCVRYDYDPDSKVGGAG